MVIFYHLCLLIADPLIPPPFSLTEMLLPGTDATISMEGYSTLLSPHFPTISLKILFLAIFGHFSPLVPTQARPLDPIPLLLTKMLSVGADEMISTERELLQCFTTAFSCHLPEN